MLQWVEFFSCCSFKNSCGMLNFQEGQHRGTKQKNFACSRILETALTASTFAYWLLHRKVLYSSSVCLLFYLKTLQSCRTTKKPEQDSVFLTSVSLSLNELSQWCLHNAAHQRKPVLAFMENCSSGSRLTWHTNCHPSLNQDAYKH